MMVKVEDQGRSVQPTESGQPLVSLHKHDSVHITNFGSPIVTSNDHTSRHPFFLELSSGLC